MHNCPRCNGTILSNRNSGEKTCINCGHSIQEPDRFYTRSMSTTEAARGIRALNPMASEMPIIPTFGTN